jgi:hypothetical protein
MPRYCYNVVITDQNGRRVLERPDARDSPQSSTEFARSVLLDVIASDPELRENDAYVGVNVYDFDTTGISTPEKIIGRFSVLDLDQAPFPANLMKVSYLTYYIISADYDDLFADAVLGDAGLDITTGTPYGLIVPGEGPAVKIRTGHSHGWITFDVEYLPAEPPDDLGAWEAVEQVTLEPAGLLRVADWRMEFVADFPPLTSDADHDYLAVRVSARDRNRPQAGVDSRRHPVEHHRVQIWPVPGLSARIVLKRDSTTEYWESQTGTP